MHLAFCFCCTPSPPQSSPQTGLRDTPVSCSLKMWGQGLPDREMSRAVVRCRWPQSWSGAGLRVWVFPVRQGQEVQGEEAAGQ